MKKKFVTHIDYDLLGNPVRIQFTDRSYTENVFAADGRKLKTSHITAVPSNNHLALGEMVLLSPSHILSVDSTEYLGNFLFDNGLFKQYHFDGGYFTTTGSEASYKYYVKDHLGSNRILASYNGTIQQETQYYPYGGIHHFSTNQGTQKFKYNGKELDLMHGLNLYDYGARLYDPLVGQFTSIDPLCEKYYSVSPYAYCAGNPVNRIDPNGDSIYIETNNGKILFEMGKSNPNSSKYAGKVYSALMDIANNGGEKYINELQNCKNVFIIKKGKQYNFEAFSIANSQFKFLHSELADKYPQKVGSGGIIIWNPKIYESGPNREGNSGRPPFIGLAHEIAHAVNSNKGMMNRVLFAPKHNVFKKVTYDEMSAMRFENIIRANAHVPLRIAYSFDENDSLFMPITF